MADIESTIREIAREVVDERLAQIASPLPEPEMITLADAATLLTISASTVEELHRNRETNGFPSFQISPRTVRVDKRRLIGHWLKGSVGVGA
jgi:hypothetical protein